MTQSSGATRRENADPYPTLFEKLNQGMTATRLNNEVKGVNRVAYRLRQQQGCTRLRGAVEAGQQQQQAAIARSGAQRARENLISSMSACRIAVRSIVLGEN